MGLCPCSESAFFSWAGVTALALASTAGAAATARFSTTLLRVFFLAPLAEIPEAVGATLAQYGGRFLVRAGATELIEGGPDPKRIVILEFADAAAFKRWYNSPEYQKILPNRFENSTARASPGGGMGGMDY